MASVFGHVAASTAIGYAFFPKETRWITILAAGFCAFAPDLDVISFHFGIPYASQWGHRGFTHSVVFGLVLGGVMLWVFQQTKIDRPWRLFAWFALSAISHPLLDMLTNGGRGCALWWPFSLERLFFPFRPIQVSPITIGDFFSDWGMEVLFSELVWIVFPGMLIVLLARLAHLGFKKAKA